MASSSEEDEEEKKIMAEIAGMATKDLTNAHIVNKEVERNNIKQKTCRRNEESDEQQESNSFLTPEFKRHIAKKLSSYLDECIQLENTPLEPKKMLQISGIHLFHSSENKLVDEQKDFLKEKNAKNIKRSNQCSSSSESSDDEEDLARFQEAAVCGHSIIDKGCLFSGIYSQESRSITHVKEEGMLKFENNKVKKKKRKKKRKDKNKTSVRT